MRSGRNAFIFDLDGVIVDTAKYHYLAWKKLADRLGIFFDETENEKFKGVSRQKSLELLLQSGGVSASESDFNQWMHDKNEDYLNLIQDMTEAEILVDVKKVLDHLKDRDQGVALGSASKNAALILDRVGLTSYFEVIIDGNKVSKAKPDPEVFIKAANGLNVSPECSVVFEDAIAGVEAANRAGMYSIGVGDTETLHHAKYVVKDFTELTLPFLDQLIDRE
jgi:beta-phosphoglucomutase